jgi:hypothetical protein
MGRFAFIFKKHSQRREAEGKNKNHRPAPIPPILNILGSASHGRKTHLHFALNPYVVYELILFQHLFIHPLITILSISKPSRCREKKKLYRQLVLNRQYSLHGNTCIDGILKLHTKFPQSEPIRVRIYPVD